MSISPWTLHSMKQIIEGMNNFNSGKILHFHFMVEIYLFSLLFSVLTFYFFFLQVLAVSSFELTCALFFLSPLIQFIYSMSSFIHSIWFLLRQGFIKYRLPYNSLCSQSWPSHCFFLLFLKSWVTSVPHHAWLPYIILQTKFIPVECSCVRLQT